MSGNPTKVEATKRVEDSNIYRLAHKNPVGKSIFLSKIIIKKHGSVQLESVGAATSDATKVAQVLVKQGLATVKSIRTEQFHRDNSGERERRFQIKLIILLEKTANFDKLTENLNKEK